MYKKTNLYLCEVTKDLYAIQYIFSVVSEGIFFSYTGRYGIDQTRPSASCNTLSNSRYWNCSVLPIYKATLPKSAGVLTIKVHTAKKSSIFIAKGWNLVVNHREIRSPVISVGTELEINMCSRDLTVLGRGLTDWNVCWRHDVCKARGATSHWQVGIIREHGFSKSTLNTYLVWTKNTP